MYDATLAETVTIRGDGGDEIEAYLARPMSPGPLGGVVVIHHMPGYDASTKEIARRFAAEGYNALMPNLYYRDAPVLPASRPVRRGRSVSLTRPGQ
jgi:carboxymethylenebutenolidase